MHGLSGKPKAPEHLKHVQLYVVVSYHIQFQMLALMPSDGIRPEDQLLYMGYLGVACLLSPDYLSTLEAQQAISAFLHFEKKTEFQVGSV